VKRALGGEPLGGLTHPSLFCVTGRFRNLHDDINKVCVVCPPYRVFSLQHAGRALPLSVGIAIAAQVEARLVKPELHDTGNTGLPAHRDYVTFVIEPKRKEKLAPWLADPQGD
jgi:hypothetical protein